MRSCLCSFSRFIFRNKNCLLIKTTQQIELVAYNQHPLLQKFTALSKNFDKKLKYIGQWQANSETNIHRIKLDSSIVHTVQLTRKERCDPKADHLVHKVAPIQDGTHFR